MEGVKDEKKRYKKNESNHAWCVNIGGQRSGSVTIQRVANSCQSTAWRLMARLARLSKLARFVLNSRTHTHHWRSAHPRGMWSGACGACNAARAGRAQFLTVTSQGDSSPCWWTKDIQRLQRFLMCGMWWDGGWTVVICQCEEPWNEDDDDDASWQSAMSGTLYVCN